MFRLNCLLRLSYWNTFSVSYFWHFDVFHQASFTMNHVQLSCIFRSWNLRFKTFKIFDQILNCGFNTCISWIKQSRLFLFRLPELTLPIIYTSTELDFVWNELFQFLWNSSWFFNKIVTEAYMCPLEAVLLWRKTLTKMDRILLSFPHLLWQGRGPIFFQKFSKILIQLIKYLKTTRHVYIFNPIIIHSLAWTMRQKTNPFRTLR